MKTNPLGAHRASRYFTIRYATIYITTPHVRGRTIGINTKLHMSQYYTRIEFDRMLRLSMQYLPADEQKDATRHTSSAQPRHYKHERNYIRRPLQVETPKSKRRREEEDLLASTSITTDLRTPASSFGPSLMLGIDTGRQPRASVRA